MTESGQAQRVREILAEARRLAVEYYDLTGKPPWSDGRGC